MDGAVEEAGIGVVEEAGTEDTLRIGVEAGEGVTGLFSAGLALINT